MNHKIFFVNKSEIEGRLDPSFYRLTLNVANTEKLGKFIQIQGGKRLPKGFDYSPNPTDFLYFRVGDMTKYHQIDFSKCHYISQEVFEILERYELFNDDLVISIAGTIGNIQIIKNIPNHQRVILTENCAKISIKKQMDIIPEFLALVLNTHFVQQQIKATSIQTTIPKLGLDKIQNLKIPQIPEKEKQREIIQFFNNSLNQFENKKQQSQTLLNSISDYLLEQLGIVVPSVDNALNNRIFMTSFSELDERLDPNFYFYRGIKMTDGHFKNIELDKIAHLIKGTSLSSKNVIDGEYPVIAGGQTSPYNHHIYNFDGETITVSASGAYLGYVAYHNYPIFASDCTVIKTIDNNEILPQFLFELLKLKQDEIYLLQKGAAQPHVYANDLAKIKIPLPDMDTQKSIVQHINQIRQQAQALEQEAIDLLKQAQDEIEMMILQ